MHNEVLPDNCSAFEHMIRVRYAETDAMGIAYNGQYFTWFEVGRTELLRAYGLTYCDMEKIGLRLPVIEAQVKYVKPVHYDDVLTIRSYLGAKPGVRVRIHYEILKDGYLAASGFTEHAFTDKNLQPVRPARHIREMLTKIWDQSRQDNDEGKDYAEQ